MFLTKPNSTLPSNWRSILRIKTPYHASTTSSQSSSLQLKLISYVTSRYKVCVIYFPCTRSSRAVNLARVSPQMEATLIELIKYVDAAGWPPSPNPFITYLHDVCCTTRYARPSGASLTRCKHVNLWSSFKYNFIRFTLNSFFDLQK